MRFLAMLLMVGVTWAFLGGEAQAASAEFGEREGRHTLAALGYTAPIELSAEQPKNSISIALPRAAAQGEPYWIGMKVHFQWSGELSEAGARAYLFGRWNGNAFYQFKADRLSDVSADFEWSMVDLVNGESRGIETGGYFEAASTNFPTLDSIRGGENTISFELNLEDAASSPISIAILPDSELLATDWAPAAVKSTATVRETEGGFDVDVRGTNTGWPAPRLAIEVVALGPGAEQRRTSARLPGLTSGEDFTWSGTIKLDGLEASSVVVVVDWGTGRTSELAWPRDGHKGLSLGQPTRIALAMAAVVSLWVSIPVALRFRARR